MDQSGLIDYLVALGRFFCLLFECIVGSSNLLKVRTFNSHQEYTIATSLLATAQGTRRAARHAALFSAKNAINRKEIPILED